MFKKMLVLYVSSFLIFSPISFADEQVTTIEKGDPAPFNGTLFNTEAAARLLTNLEFSQETCQIEIDRQLDLKTAQLELKIDNLNSSLSGCTQRYKDILKIKNDQIIFLDDQLKKSSPNNKVLWFAIGIASGVIITGVAGWSLGQISSQQ